MDPTTIACIACMDGYEVQLMLDRCASQPDVFTSNQLLEDNDNALLEDGSFALLEG